MRPLAKILEDKLTDEELGLVPRSYDVIGSKEKAVAVIEIPKELENKKQLIAKAIMKLNKSIKSVLNKISGRKGTYRLEDLELVAGDKNTEVIHKEHGYLLKIDPRKVFFSPRESTERQRIASQVKSSETVLLLFAGIGVYGITIVKRQPHLEKVVAVEINPVAVEYMKENIRINKISHKVLPIFGDVRKACLKYYGKFDRVIMPLAIGGWKYLDTAFHCLKPTGGIIHFYHIGRDDDLYKKSEEIVDDVAKKLKRKFKIINKTRVLPFGTRKHKIVLDVLAH